MLKYEWVITVQQNILHSEEGFVKRVSSRENYPNDRGEETTLTSSSFFLGHISLVSDVFLIFYYTIDMLM
jgi:hypothetical protein